MTQIFGTCPVQAVWVFLVPQNEPIGLAACTQAYSYCIYQVEEIQDAKPPWYPPSALSVHAQKICLAFPDKLQMLYHLKHWTSNVNVHVAMFFSGKITNKRSYRIPGWMRLEGTSEPSGPASLLRQGHPRGHCTALHPDCSWIVLWKSRTLLALIHFLKSIPNADISIALQLLAVISHNAI